jgi:hypothetical protein
MSKFNEGQKVVCINDNFPVKATTEANKSIIGTIPTAHPQKGETLVIDEMLGDEWLRFDKYDGHSWNWWHSSRFRPLDDFEIMLNSDQNPERSVATESASSNVDSNTKQIEP